MIIFLGAHHSLINYHSLVPSSAHYPDIGQFSETVNPRILSQCTVSTKQIPANVPAFRGDLPVTYLKILCFGYRASSFTNLIQFPLSFPDPLIVIVDALCAIKRAYLNWVLCYQSCLISSFVLSIIRLPALMERRESPGIMSSWDLFTFYSSHLEMTEWWRKKESGKVQCIGIEIMLVALAVVLCIVSQWGLVTLQYDNRLLWDWTKTHHSQVRVLNDRSHRKIKIRRRKKERKRKKIVSYFLICVFWCMMVAAEIKYRTEHPTSSCLYEWVPKKVRIS